MNCKYLYCYQFIFLSFGLILFLGRNHLRYNQISQLFNGFFILNNILKEILKTRFIKKFSNIFFYGLIILIGLEFILV